MQAKTKKYIQVSCDAEYETVVNYLLDEGQYEEAEPVSSFPAILVLDEEAKKVKVFFQADSMVSNDDFEKQKDVISDNLQCVLYEDSVDFLDYTLSDLNNLTKDWAWDFNEEDERSIIVNGEHYETQMTLNPYWPDRFCNRVLIDGKKYYFS